MNVANAEEARVIEDLVIEYLNRDTKPNRAQFRADRPGQLDLIDMMETKGLLMSDSQGGYEIKVHHVRSTKFWPAESRRSNALLKCLCSVYADNIGKTIPREQLISKIFPVMSDVEFTRAARYLYEANFLGGYNSADGRVDITGVIAAEAVIRFKTIEDKLDKDRAYNESFKKKRVSTKLAIAQSTVAVRSLSKEWEGIRRDYRLSRPMIGKKLNFMSPNSIRRAILRDIEQAYGCLDQHYYKPAVVLAGGVVEEVLRQYLQHKGIPPGKEFIEHINAAREHKMLKASLVALTDSVRGFRNLVHIAKEKDPKFTTNGATAKVAVSAMFAIINDL